MLWPIRRNTLPPSLKTVFSLALLSPVIGNAQNVAAYSPILLIKVNASWACRKSGLGLEPWEVAKLKKLGGIDVSLMGVMLPKDPPQD